MKVKGPIDETSLATLIMNAVNINHRPTKFKQQPVKLVHSTSDDAIEEVKIELLDKPL